MEFRRLHKLMLVVCGLFLVTSCSSSDEPGEGNTNQGARTNIIKPKKAVNGAGMKFANANSNVTRDQSTSNRENPTLNNANVKIINTANAPVSIPSRRLRDNSELSTSMSKDGAFVETRRFLNHSQLERLERITKSPDDQKFQVRLRDGRVIPLPKSKIKNFRVDSADTILRAVGIQPAKRGKEVPTNGKEEMMKRRPIIRSPLNR